jgi:hypothetical protein
MTDGGCLSSHRDTRQRVDCSTEVVFEVRYDEANIFHRGVGIDRRHSLRNADHNCIGKTTMQCLSALKPAWILVLASDRWPQVLVRGQADAVEIIIGVASASSGSSVEFKRRSCDGPGRERSIGCASEGDRFGYLRRTVASQDRAALGKHPDRLPGRANDRINLPDPPAVPSGSVISPRRARRP